MLQLQYSTFFPMHTEGASLQTVQEIKCPELNPATSTIQIHEWQILSYCQLIIQCNQEGVTKSAYIINNTRKIALKKNKCAYKLKKKI